MSEKRDRRPPRRSAVQLTNFVTRLHKVGAKPTSIKLYPDGTLEAFFAPSEPAGLDLESKMQKLMG